MQSSSGQVSEAQSAAGVHLLSDVLHLLEPEDEHLQEEVLHQTRSHAPHCNQHLCLAQGDTIMIYLDQMTAW